MLGIELSIWFVLSSSQPTYSDVLDTNCLRLFALSYPHRQGFLGGVSGKEPASKCRRHKTCEFDPWVGTIPWRRVWKPTPVVLSGESHGQRRLWSIE